MICKNCGYRMGEGLRFCPRCASPTGNFMPVKIQAPKEKRKRNRKARTSNTESEEINQWYIMGIFK